MRSIKYLATIKLGADSSSQTFNTIHECKTWLDSQNNNLEHTTIISELDDKWNVIDWFYYTEGLEK